MDHMPAMGVSGIDVYRFDAAKGRWRYVKAGRITSSAGATLSLDWTPGTPCLVNLPLYNGIKTFTLGIDPEASVSPLPPRASGIDKPVVFYGTSITQGGCASRPGMSFVNIVGRDLDVPVVNLGFSGSGLMELEMSEHLAAIDASCYVLDCVWNMRSMTTDAFQDRYETFIRNLRARRPDVPIVMAGMSDVYCGGPNDKDACVRALYERLVAEGCEQPGYEVACQGIRQSRETGAEHHYDQCQVANGSAHSRVQRGRRVVPVGRAARRDGSPHHPAAKMAASPVSAAAASMRSVP